MENKQRTNPSGTGIQLWATCITDLEILTCSFHWKIEVFDADVVTDNTLYSMLLFYIAVGIVYLVN